MQPKQGVVALHKCQNVGLDIQALFDCFTHRHRLFDPLSAIVIAHIAWSFHSCRCCDAQADKNPLVIKKRKLYKRKG